MTQPEALRLAEHLKFPAHCPNEYVMRMQAAAELRRLHDVEKAYKSACDIVEEQDKKLVELEAVNRELLEALNNIEVSTHDAMTAALARAAIAKAEAQS